MSLNLPSLAFLADGRRFGYFRVGGTESYVRRLARAIAAAGSRVDYVLYNQRAQTTLLSPLWNIQCTPGLSDAFHLLQVGCYDHVISVSVGGIDIFRFALYRRLKGRTTKFHRINFGGAGNGIRGLVQMLANIVGPYNGTLVTLSEEAKRASRVSRCVVVRPPVPELFCLSPEAKPVVRHLTVLFVGRLDPEKGIYDVLDLFGRLAKHRDIRSVVYGYSCKHLRRSRELDSMLRSQSRIEYHSAEHEGYSDSHEAELAQIYRNADVVVLPYYRLDRTIDPPLVLLEAMASLCIPLTRRVGAVSEVVPPEFVHDGENFVGWAEQRIRELLKGLRQRQVQLADWNQRLGLRSIDAARAFRDAIATSA